MEVGGDVTDAGQTPEQLKIELLSQWKLEAEFRKYIKALMKSTSNMSISDLVVDFHQSRGL